MGFQIIDLLESGLMDGFLYDGLICLHSKVARANCLAKIISGPAAVLTSIFRKNMRDVKRNKPKVMSFTESGAYK